MKHRDKEREKANKREKEREVIKIEKNMKVRETF